MPRTGTRVAIPRTECDGTRHQTIRRAASGPARRSRTASVASPEPPARASTRLAEHRLELHRKPHVALDLDLAAHEGHGSVELAGGQVDEVLRLHGDGDVGI